MTDQMPETLPENAPKSILRAHQQPDGIFLAESAHEVREKLREFDPHESEDGFITVMAMDVITTSRGEEEPSYFPYEHSLRPQLVLDVREITVGWWRATHGQVKQQAPDEEQPQQIPGLPPGVRVISGIGSLGELFEQGLPGYGPPPPPDSSDTTHEGIPAVRDEVEDTVECCCGHAVAAHGDAQKFVGACMVENCSCNLFHTHPEETEADGEQQA